MLWILNGKVMQQRVETKEWCEVGLKGEKNRGKWTKGYSEMG